MILNKPGFALLAVLALAGCASTPTAITNQDPTVDFAAYETFGWVGRLGTDAAEYESLITNFLKVAISQELGKRGMTYSADPDVRVNFYINTKERIRSRSVPTAGAYYGWRDPFYDTWGGYGGYETRIDQFTEGTLHIDVVDTSTNRLAWEGHVSGRITDEVIANLEKAVDSGVRIIMADFPIPPGGAAEN